MRVIDGKLEDRIVRVEEIDVEAGVVRVMTQMMGRDVMAELDLDQVETL